MEVDTAHYRRSTTSKLRPSGGPRCGSLVTKRAEDVVQETTGKPSNRMGYDHECEL